MRLFSVILVLGISLLTSCRFNNRPSQSEFTRIIVDEHLTKLPCDSIRLLHEYGLIRDGGFGDLDGYCTKEGDTTTVFFTNGIGFGLFLRVKLVGDSVKMIAVKPNCLVNEVYKSLEQILVLNKTDIHVGDTIIGELFYKGEYVLNPAKNRKETRYYVGRFKVAVHDTMYTYRDFQLDQAALN